MVDPGPMRPPRLVEDALGTRAIPAELGDGGIRNKKRSPKVSATGRTAQVKARYDAHLPYLSLRDGENSRSILEGAVLPTLHSHIICKNWHLYGVCWEDCERKGSHVPTPPEVATTISRLLKVDQG